MKENGMYVATRFFPQTGSLIRGQGVTMEEARKELKGAVKAYREATAKGTYLKGVVGVDGNVHSVARPALAQYLSLENAKKAKALKK